MSTLQIIANLLAYACFGFGTLLIWPSRRNVIAWMSFPFYITTALIPLLVINYGEVSSQQTIDTLTTLNIFGALAMAAGIVLGGHVRLPRIRLPSFARRRAWSDPVLPIRRTFAVMVVGCVLMTFCFAWMGTLPIFAEQPFLAKFFKGPYKEKYDQVAVIYRFAQAILAAAMPMAIAFLVAVRDRKMLLVVGWAVAIFALSLNRGTVVAGAVLLIAAWSSESRRRLVVFLTFSTMLYALGSSVYVLLGILVPNDFNLWVEIAHGAPDVNDHLAFLGKFDPFRDLTYGMTFIGGLVPSNFMYNPSVYTLAIVNDTFDISDIASGGFRLPPSVSGYMAFGWFGALVVPFVSGVISGHFTRRYRAMPKHNLAQHVAVLLWYQFCAGFWVGFYSLSYQGVISIIIFLWLVPSIDSLGRLAPARKVNRRRLLRWPRPAGAPVEST